MKGIIFTELQKMVDEVAGIGLWDEVIEKLKLESNGIYVSGATYDDNELYKIIGELSHMTNKTVEELIKNFGKWLLLDLSKKYRLFFKGLNAKQFLLSIDKTIHIEVNKLYEGAKTPSFTYDEPSETTLVMEYRSDRSLCKLAEGLIDGAAEYFGTQIKYVQTLCKLTGSDHCRFELEFGSLKKRND